MYYTPIPYDVLFPYTFPPPKYVVENGDIVREFHNNGYGDYTNARIHTTDLTHYLTMNPMW